MDHPNLVPLRQIEDLDKLLTGGQPLPLPYLRPILGSTRATAGTRNTINTAPITA